MPVNNPEIDKALKKFKVNLEKVLDEHFPKIIEEGEKKRLNKRSQALMLYCEAVLEAKSALLSVYKASGEESVKAQQMQGQVAYKQQSDGLRKFFDAVVEVAVRHPLFFAAIAKKVTGKESENPGTANK